MRSLLKRSPENSDKGYMAEKRRHVRASLQTEVWLGQDGIFTHTSETLRDLSESGAFIEASQGFALGSIIYLRFRLPYSEQLVSCSVIVRNIRQNGGFGVEFLDISPYDRQQIRSFKNALPISSEFALIFSRQNI